MDLALGLCFVGTALISLYMTVASIYVWATQGTVPRGTEGASLELWVARPLPADVGWNRDYLIFHYSQSHNPFPALMADFILDESYEPERFEQELNKLYFPSPRKRPLTISQARSIRHKIEVIKSAWRAASEILDEHFV